MKHKNIVIPSLILLIVIGAITYLKDSPEPLEPEVSETKPTPTPVQATAPTKAPPPVPSTFAPPKAEGKVEDETAKRFKAKFRAAGLTEEKSQAMFDLNNFYEDMPTFNEENFKKREKILSVLNENPAQTADAFKKLMSEAGPEDDALRSFLVNTAGTLDLTDEDRVELVVSRASKGATFNKDGSLTDNELSLAIGLSSLARIQDPQARARALDDIMDKGPKTEEFRQLVKDYFPVEGVNQ